MLEIPVHLLESDCSHCTPSKTLKGLRQDYIELIELLKTKGVENWKGPREETILVQTLQISMFAGMVAGSIYAYFNKLSLMQDFASVLVTAVLSMMGFAVVGIAIYPFVGKKSREKYLSSSQRFRRREHE